MPLAKHIAHRTNVWDKVEILEEHAHSASCVYPTLASDVVVAASATANTLGAFVEIIPANTILKDFDLHWMDVSGASDPETFEIVFYVETTEIGRVRFTVAEVAGNRVALPPLRLQTNIIKANSQIQAKIASIGGGENVSISLQYHTY